MRLFRPSPISIALLMSTLCLVADDASGLGVTYSYDLTGRIAAASYDNGLCIAYSYDPSGNRTAQTNAATGAPVWGSSTWGCFVWTP
jgi:YD repeat-containing protein